MQVAQAWISTSLDCNLLQVQNQWEMFPNLLHHNAAIHWMPLMMSRQSQRTTISWKRLWNRWIQMISIHPTSRSAMFMMSRQRQRKTISWKNPLTWWIQMMSIHPTRMSALWNYILMTLKQSKKKAVSNPAWARNLLGYFLGNLHVCWTVMMFYCSIRMSAKSVTAVGSYNVWQLILSVACQHLEHGIMLQDKSDNIGGLCWKKLSPNARSCLNGLWSTSKIWSNHWPGTNIEGHTAVLWSIRQFWLCTVISWYLAWTLCLQQHGWSTAWQSPKQKVWSSLHTTGTVAQSDWVQRAQVRIYVQWYCGKHFNVSLSGSVSLVCNHIYIYIYYI